MQWATNQPIAKYYGNDCQSYRTVNAPLFFEYIQKHKMAIIGIDYYALYGVCANIIPEGILKQKYKELLSGKVLVYRVVLIEDKIYWTQLNLVGR